jgi:hypothetical protein
MELRMREHAPFWRFHLPRRVFYVLTLPSFCLNAMISHLGAPPSWRSRPLRFQIRHPSDPISTGEFGAKPPSNRSRVRSPVFIKDCRRYMVSSQEQWLRIW